jgi:hypothetical protein
VINIQGQVLIPLTYALKKRTGQRLFRLLFVEHLSDLTVNESLSESHSGIQVSLHVLVIIEEIGANFSSRKKPAVKIHQSCTEKRKL